MARNFFSIRILRRALFFSLTAFFFLSLTAFLKKITMGDLNHNMSTNSHIVGKQRLQKKNKHFQKYSQFTEKHLWPLFFMSVWIERTRLYVFASRLFFLADAVLYFDPQWTKTFDFWQNGPIWWFSLRKILWFRTKWSDLMIHWFSQLWHFEHLNPTMSQMWAPQKDHQKLDYNTRIGKFAEIWGPPWDLHVYFYSSAKTSN